jgi:hypothetical protein
MSETSSSCCSRGQKRLAPKFRPLSSETGLEILVTDHNQDPTILAGGFSAADVRRASGPECKDGAVHPTHQRNHIVMFRLDIPFHLSSKLRGLSPGGHAQSLGRGAAAVRLEGLLLSVETGENTRQVVSEQPPLPDGPGQFNGTLWPYFLLPLLPGAWIEQQMMLPATGDAAAVSWRLVGSAAGPVKLRVSPIFAVDRPFTRTSFEVEPRESGGRMTWRPFLHSSQVLIDTNGRLLERSAEPAPGAAPGTFEFRLSSNPSLLILCAERAQCEGRIDPMIGGFLAQLKDERVRKASQDRRLNLIAA